MKKIIVKNDKDTIEWSDVPEEVINAVTTLLYAIEENQDIDMVSRLSDTRFGTN